MAKDKPQILVLVGDGEPELPGLEAIHDDADIRHVDSEAELHQYLPDSDILVVTDFRSELLQRNWPEQHRIRWVHATSAGVDVLMFEQLVHSDIVLTNARGVFDRGIAEYVLGAIMMFAKDFIGNIQLQQQRHWQHRDTELALDRQVLILGVGAIGQHVAELLSLAGLRVSGIGRSAREQPPFEQIYAQQQLREQLPNCDYLVIAAPLTAETHGLIDYDTLCYMKPGARLINVARGPIVNTDDLVRALEEKRIAGAALDVFEEEPLPAEHPLWDLPQVMISAHMAGDVIGWRRTLGEQFVANFRRWQRSEPLLNRVDKLHGFVSSH